MVNPVAVTSTVFIDEKKLINAKRSETNRINANQKIMDFKSNPSLTKSVTNQISSPKIKRIPPMLAA